MMKSLAIFLLGAVLVTSLGSPVEAKDERISNLVVRTTDTDILVSAKLIRGFSETSEQDIKNGIPKDLFYYVLLKKRQAFWIDEELLSQTIKYTVKYDLLKKQFHVTRRIDGAIQQEITEDFMTMKRLISTIDNVRIAGTRVLADEDTYYVSVKAEMKAAKLPFYLDYFLFFIPFLEVDTPWANSAPFYK